MCATMPQRRQQQFTRTEIAERQSEMNNNITEGMRRQQQHTAHSAAE